MQLNFSYDMHDSFSLPVREHHFSLMCIPRDTNRQRVLECHTEISPCSYQAEDRDFFGNRYIYGEAIAPHDSFHVRIYGTVETGLACEEHYDTEQLALFRLQSAYTCFGPAMRALYAELSDGAPEAGAAYENALYLMHGVHSLMRYDPTATDIHTTAECAAAQRCGVCQDYAHILLSLLRAREIPARYVVGMMAGEGASHAWVEANCRGYWYGLDPTNDLLVGDGYIKLSHGRDYSDCIVNKGVFRTVCLEQKQISLRVEAAEES